MTGASTAVPIPRLALERLRASYADYQRALTFVLTGMGLDPLHCHGVDLEAGIAIVNAEPKPEVAS